MTEVEKMGIGKSKIGLLISVVLIVILAISSLWLYTTANTLQTDKDSLQTQINNLQSQAISLETWLDGNKTLLQTTINERNQLQTWLDGNVTDYESQIQNLNSQITTLNSQINSLNAQITNLQNQIDALKAPKLIEVNLRAEDNRPWLQTPYLHIYGYVCNVGTNTAYDAILYVEAFQGEVLAFNTTISLGTIGGESYTYVDSKIYYSGSALTEWDVWSRPTGINMGWIVGNLSGSIVSE